MTPGSLVEKPQGAENSARKKTAPVSFTSLKTAENASISGSVLSAKFPDRSATDVAGLGLLDHRVGVLFQEKAFLHEFGRCGADDLDVLLVRVVTLFERWPRVVLRHAFRFCLRERDVTAVEAARLSFERTSRRHIPSGVGAQWRRRQRRSHTRHFIAVRIHLDDELRQRPRDLRRRLEHAGA